MLSCSLVDFLSHLSNEAVGNKGVTNLFLKVGFAMRPRLKILRY